MRTDRRLVRIGGGALLALALLAYGWLVVTRANDFQSFYDVGEATRLHGDIYALGPRAGMHVPYVPIFGLVMAPFSLLPLRWAALVWFALKWVGLAFLVRWLGAGLRAELPGAGARRLAAYVVLPFLVAFNPFMSDFRLGQSNLWVLVFSILTVRALERGKPLPAAFFFSLATVKVTALALLPWLVFRRQWRFLLALLPVGAAWLVALGAWWGPANVPGLFREWIVSTASTRAGSAPLVAYYENQSLQGAAARLAELLPALHRPVLGLPAQYWLWILPSLAIAGILLASAAHDRFRPRLPPEELALGSLLMLLASGDSRWAHHVQLFVPLAVLAVLGARVHLLESVPRLGPWLAGGSVPGAGAVEADPAARRLRRVLAGLLVAGVVILVVLGRDVVGPTVNRAVRAMSFHTAFDVALAVFLAARLLRRPPGAGVEAPVRSLSAVEASQPSA